MRSEKLCLILALVFLVNQNVECLEFPNEILNYLSEYDIIRPKIKTSNDDENFIDHTSFNDKNNDQTYITEIQIKTKDKLYHLDLKKNENLHSDNIKTLADKSDFPNCHYHATFKRGNGNAAISTCDGFTGSIHDEDEEKIFHFTKLSDGNHIMYDVNNMKNDVKRPLGVPITRPTHSSHRERRNAADSSQDEQDSIFGVSDDDMKYVEMGIVADLAFVELFDSTEASIIKVGEIMNHADFLWRKFNISLVLTHLDVVTDQDPFDSPSLSGLNQYKWDTLITQENWKIDVIHLLTGKSLGGAVGVAYFGEFCAGIPEGVTSYWVNSQVSGGILAHEFGHNFAIAHDGDSCSCDISGACTMSSYITPSGFNGWSNCSYDRVKHRCDIGYCQCISKDPKRTWDGPICGNNVVEDGEECDVGTDETNPCCDASTCKHKPGVECAHGACCHQCQFISKGTTCRDAKNQCDIPETCSGTEAKCPANVYLENYSECGDDSYCSHGICLPSLDDLCAATWGEDSTFGSVEDCKTGERYHYNMRGDEQGNCGQEDGVYFPCHFRDSSCGKLQCKGARSLSRLYSRVWEYTSLTNNNCYSFKIPFGNDVSDVTLPMDGTKCADSKVCHLHQCLDINIIQDHVMECHGKCGNNGKCLSNGHCYCNKGFQCPNCDTSDVNNVAGMRCPVPPTVTKPTPEVPSTSCHCENGGVCDSDGYCYCKVGFACPLCEDKDSSNTNGRQCHDTKTKIVIDNEGIPVPSCPYKCINGGICNLYTRACVCPAGKTCPDCAGDDAAQTTETKCEPNRELIDMTCDSQPNEGITFSGHLEKYGCKAIWSQDRSRSVLLKSYRHIIIWTQQKYNLHEIICKCSQLAREQGYKFIMIRFYGECWGSNDYDYAYNTSPDPDCIHQSYSNCGEKEICSGTAYEAFVYRVMIPTK